MKSVPDVTGIEDDEYETLLYIEDGVVWPLYRGYQDIVDAVMYLMDDGEVRHRVDNPQQREYIRTYVDEMIYQLNRIRDMVEG